ncbi:hypothetical protein IKE87_00325 [Candidatus Saccharibacteria bacterium]|nr:hypothetical protein [Candidatus Saccharibacteria bacterium]
MIKMVGRRNRRVYYILAGVFVMMLVFSFLALKFKNNDEVSAADLGKFNPGYIISDFQMSDYNSMSEAEIQNFLRAKNPCGNTNHGYYAQLSANPNYRWHFENGHFICLSEERFGNNDNEIGFQYGESAAHIIWQAAQDYRINPKAIIVLLQKETGLITDPIPNNGDYRKATGYGCPDTAACSSQYYGFKNQVRNAVALFRTVLDGGWTNYPVGNNYVQYNPNAACGGSVINIQNRATSALYRYTPYQPNAGALAAGYGTAPCGAYGNRNFYQYYEDWFGNITGEATYEGFITPRYMKLKEETDRVSTYTGEKFDTLEAGRVLKYTTKIFIRGGWYYRSEVCSNGGLDVVVPAEALEEMPAYGPFVIPRNMKTTSAVNRVNPYTGETFDSLEAGRVLKYVSKVQIDGRWYYRSENCTLAKIDAVVPAEDLKEAYEDFINPRYMRLTEGVTRVSTYTGENYDTLEMGRVLKYTTKIFIRGEWYYRSEVCTGGGLDVVVPARMLSEVAEQYEPFITPRNMRLKEETARINPYTNEVYDVLEEGRVLKYTTKINIGGEWYYRTEACTQGEADITVPAKALEEI